MGHPLKPKKSRPAPWWGWGALCLVLPSWAQDVGRPVYRCPGPPVLYTDAIAPEEARERNCRVIEGAPLSVMQAPRRPSTGAAPATAGASGPAGAGAASSGGAGGAAGASRTDARVDAAAQRTRDAEARRILTSELRREEERLEQLRREFNNGEPERRGDERNFALYQQRVEEMRALIARKEADVTALRRELARLGP